MRKGYKPITPADHRWEKVEAFIDDHVVSIMIFCIGTPLAVILLFLFGTQP